MTEYEIKGMIADIQRFSLHDGPGIRTTVFLKGCNMRCAWCHNPETQAFEPQMLIQPDKCIGCGKCAEGCFSGARKLCGVEKTVASVLEEILLDKPYYGAEGGLTVSGGEPACQPGFTEALLRACNENSVNTALETNMSVPWTTLARFLSHCDLLMCDLKLWNGDDHRKWTGVSNDAIKGNIIRAAEMGMPILLRTPVVPGVNDNDAEIGSIARFAAGIETLMYYELLPYHALGLAKGELEGYKPVRFEKPAADDIQKLALTASEEGIPVKIAGKTANRD